MSFIKLFCCYNAANILLVFKLPLPGPAAAGAPVRVVGAAGVPGGTGDINVIIGLPDAPPVAMMTWKYKNFTLNQMNLSKLAQNSTTLAKG